jgi:HlyD family secretion protein
MKTSSPSSPAPAPAPKTPAARPRRRSRAWPWIGAGVLVAAIVAGLWPQALPVELATVARGDLVVTVDEQGMTRVKNRYVISSPVAGQLQRIDWKAGAMVEAGRTPLAVIGTSGAAFLDARGQAEAEARIRATAANRKLAAARRDRARAAQALADSDLERFRALNATGAISKQDFDGATMRAATAAQDVRAGEFALQVAQFEEEQARAMLLRGRPGGNADESPLVVTSPVSGRILRVLQESARVVPAGLPLLEVGDPTDLEARIEVLSRDGVAIHPGARVTIEQWGGDHPLEARVRLVEPSAFTKISALGVEEQRVYVVVDFVDPIEQRPTLGDNYRVEARIVVWEGKQVLRVPAGALFQRGNTWQTFVASGGRAQVRTVEVGRSNGLETEIRGGLREGERVVVYPGDKIDDGSRITPLVTSAR